MTDDYDEIAASWEDDDEDEVREACFWCAKPKDGLEDDDTTEVLDVQPCPECEKLWNSYKEQGYVILFEYTTKPYETLCERGYSKGQADRIQEMCDESGFPEYILTGSRIAISKEEFDEMIAPSLDPETLEETYEAKMMFVEDDIFTDLFRTTDEEDETNEDT